MEERKTCPRFASKAQDYAKKAHEIVQEHSHRGHIHTRSFMSHIHAHLHHNLHAAADFVGRYDHNILG